MSVWRTERGRCWICLGDVAPQDASRDHMRPRAQGGYNKRSNYRLAHQVCNSARDQIDPADVRAIVASFERPTIVRVVAALRNYRAAA